MNEKEKRKATKAKKNTDYLGIIINMKCEDAGKKAEELRQLSKEFIELLKALLGQ